MLLDGPMNGVAFLAYVEQVLVPTLVPGDQVIMDNLPAHKVAGVKQAIEAVILHRMLITGEAFRWPEKAGRRRQRKPPRGETTAGATRWPCCKADHLRMRLIRKSLTREPELDNQTAMSKTHRSL